MRDIFALPCRFGGLGVSNPVTMARRQFHKCVANVDGLSGKIAGESPMQVHGLSAPPANDDFWQEKVRLLCLGNAKRKRLLDFAGEKGASAVFSLLPLARYGFAFRAKRDFWDLISALPSAN